MKGANTVPFLIRKTEPRPLRVFLQDGENDQNSEVGQLVPAEPGDGLGPHPHELRPHLHRRHRRPQHGARRPILPDALRWLWRGYPAAIEVAPPVAAGVEQDPSVGGGPALRPATFNIVSHDAGWESIGATYASAASPAGDKDGNVYFAIRAATRSTSRMRTAASRRSRATPAARRRCASVRTDASMRRSHRANASSLTAWHHRQRRRLPPRRSWRATSMRTISC